MTNSHPNGDVPLVVDLDDTMLATDSLWEGLCAMLASDKKAFFRALFSKSRLELKNAAAPYGAVGAPYFPLHSSVTEYMRMAVLDGRKVFIATASPRDVAEACAARGGEIAGILASSDTINLKGHAKADALVQKFGAGKFDYIGNSLDDVPVWRVARRAIVAGQNPRTLSAARSANANMETISVKQPSLRATFTAMRPEQWVKNLLVFLPMLMAHAFFAPLFGKCLLAFLALSLCASAIYIANDICDLASDRQHPCKKHRPFASGALPLSRAPVIFGSALGISIAICFFLPLEFLPVLAVYFGSSLLYSLYIKRVLFLDVIALAFLYVLRIVAGAAATGGGVSDWLVGFAGFFFLGLALFKRGGASGMRDPEAPVPGRPYLGKDRTIMESMAVCSGFCSVMIVALYIDSLQASKLYRNPHYLWLACPILVYWYGRMAILAQRGNVGDDPVRFAVRDKVSWLTLAALVLVLFIAI